MAPSDCGVIAIFLLELRSELTELLLIKLLVSAMISPVEGRLGRGVEVWLSFLLGDFMGVFEPGCPMSAPVVRWPNIKLEIVSEELTSFIRKWTTNSDLLLLSAKFTQYYHSLNIWRMHCKTFSYAYNPAGNGWVWWFCKGRGIVWYLWHGVRHQGMLMTLSHFESLSFESDHAAIYPFFRIQQDQ